MTFIYILRNRYWKSRTPRIWYGCNQFGMFAQLFWTQVQFPLQFFQTCQSSRRYRSKVRTYKLPLFVIFNSICNFLFRTKYLKLIIFFEEETFYGMRKSELYGITDFIGKIIEIFRNKMNSGNFVNFICSKLWWPIRTLHRVQCDFWNRTLLFCVSAHALPSTPPLKIKPNCKHKQTKRSYLIN